MAHDTPKITNAGELRQYQIDGANFLIEHDRALLADQMGLGKTVQAIAAANVLAPSNVLIICPASLKLNWRNEWKRFSTLKLSLGVADGQFWPDTSVVIINYDILGKHRARIRDRHWNIILLDEAHYAKTPKSQRTKEILGSKSQGISALWAPYKWAMTGTPVLNRPIEVWTLLHWLGAERLPDYFKFGMRYCNGHKVKFGHRVHWDFRGASKLDELRDWILRGVMLRRLKADVLKDLPEKQRQVVPFKISGEFERREKAVVGKDFESAIETMDGAVAKFTELAEIRQEIGIAKLPQVIEFIESALEQSDKIVLFAHHVAVVAELCKALRDYGVVTVIGGMTAEQKQASVDEFQKGAARVFVGNIQAAGVGLTLTAASHVIFVELSWVPGEMAQAEDRCHRFGQKNSVLVQYLVAEGTLEAAMAKALIRKEKIIKKTLDS